MALRLLIRWGAIVLLAMMIAELMNRETSCRTDPDIPYRDTMLSTCRFFSETYIEARSKFQQAATAVGAELYTFPVTSEDYTMDIAVIKGNLPGVVIHTSGYHGVEGYAGSAIQVAWLTLLSKQQQQGSLYDGPTAILVHAVNPYGMAHYRRTNEHNVDLNRNGLHKWPVTRDPNIANYQDFDAILFNLPRAPTTWDRYVGIWWMAARAIRANGLAALKRAMVTGQYHNAKGIIYGGNQTEPSLTVLYDFLKKHVSSKAGPVTMVNVHTGLGRSGEDTIMTLDSTAFTPDELSETFVGSHIPGLNRTANDVESGYDLVIGTAEHYFSKLFSGKKDLICTQEFGTVPTIFVGVALLLENMARQYLPENEAQEWTLLTKRAFYQETLSWRSSVLLSGLRVLQQAIDRSSTS